MTPSNLRSISRQLYSPVTTFADARPVVAPSNHFGQYDRIQCAQAGTRYDRKTGQYFPTLNGKDVSPTSFDENRALLIAQNIARTL